ncbi:MAG: SRPBCC domain-containing protein [Planctomycetes bacterium]|nr:SRPBCC domain-containing protein [Planctomycetota bacterium]MCB9935593.1 SRPBCC domain-containing protein [Planctomycetota bacterium]
MARLIQTEILIHAAPQRVWDVLTDFDRLGEWSPFFESIEGWPLQGERLLVKFRKGPTFKPRVIEAEVPRVLEWLGRLLIPGLFDGRHRFELRAEGQDTRLLHTERFTGLLVPLFGAALDKTAQDFAAFNAALKSRAEGGTDTPSGGA